MRGMLENLTVIDITNNIAGPGCAAMLADHGAEVIHVEKPIFGLPSFFSNDRERQRIPFLRQPQQKIRGSGSERSRRCTCNQKVGGNGRYSD